MSNKKEKVENTEEIKDNAEVEAPKEEKKVVSCEFCGKRFDTMKQVRGHQMRCAEKQAVIRKQIEDEEAKLNATGDGPRKERVPLDALDAKLVVKNKDRDFRYRFLNDNWGTDPSRLLRANDAYYEKVDHPMNGSHVGENKDGSPIRVYLHRIPREFYEEDMARREEKTRKSDDKLRTGETGRENEFEGLSHKETGKSAIVPLEIKYNP